MSKVTIKAKVKIDQADYDKIMEFSQRDDSEGNIALRDLNKLLKDNIDFNIKSILAQIAAIETQCNTVVDTTVGLLDAQGKPLLPSGGNGDG